MASLVVIFFGVVYHISVESSYKRLEKSDYQKEILLNEIHHRIKNSLHLISSLLGLQQRDEKDPKLEKILEKNRLRIQSIAMVHDALYKYDSFEEISFDTYTRKLCDTVLDLYGNKTTVTIQKSNIYLSIQNTLRFGIITNELLTNSLKHAFADEAGEVTISLLKTEDNYIYKYNDNGKIAIDKKEFMKDDTLGLKIIYMMVEQMDGELRISVDSGFGFEIVVGI
jgi:two-component sensor histidine kinase